MAFTPAHFDLSTVGRSVASAPISSRCRLGTGSSLLLLRSPLAWSLWFILFDLTPRLRVRCSVPRCVSAAFGDSIQPSDHSDGLPQFPVDCVPLVPLSSCHSCFLAEAVLQCATPLEQRSSPGCLRNAESVLRGHPQGLGRGVLVTRPSAYRVCAFLSWDSKVAPPLTCPFTVHSQSVRGALVAQCARFRPSPRRCQPSRMFRPCRFSRLRRLAPV